MKKSFKIVGILILMLILFRGTIYRLVVKYTAIDTRPEIEITDSTLIHKIESKAENKEMDLKGILDIADKITCKELKFTTKHASANPNELINSNEANCVGYAGMFNSITNYLIRKSELHNEIEAEHKVGVMEFLGINIHHYFRSPFFRDHDFNEITNLKSGDKILIDPSLSDYLWIKSVSKKD